MSEVLSQSEIDALLKAINEGEISAEVETEPTMKVKEFDFRTANRFSKEQIRTLNIIYENFARLFTTYLSGTLRAMCQVDVVSVEELKYQDFTNALPAPVLLAILGMKPLVGPTVMEISPDVTYSMISRLLGGAGSGGEVVRSFTEIEMVLMERLIRQFIRLLREAWEKVATVDPLLERTETSPQFAQICAHNETVVIVTLNVKVDNAEGLMNFCLPHVAIEPVAKRLNTKLWFQTSVDRRISEQADGGILQQIEHTPLPITAVFKDTTASVRDILGLQVGDIVQLEHHVTDALIVKVGHLDKFYGALGVKDKRYAVKIIGSIREEDAANE